MNVLNFWKKQKTLRWRNSELFSNNENFSEKFRLVSFWSLRSFNFTQNFRKIMSRLWEKLFTDQLMYWRIDMLTYWQWQFHRATSGYGWSLKNTKPKSSSWEKNLTNENIA